MKSAYETPEVKSVTAWAILHDGEHAGNVVTRYSRTGGVTATVSLWDGPWGGTDARAWHGFAGGGGYDKVSAAIADAAWRSPEGSPLHEALHTLGGRGAATVRRAFEEAGYQVVEVIS